MLSRSSPARATFEGVAQVTASTVYPDLAGASKLTFDYSGHGVTSRAVMSSLTAPKVDAQVATAVGGHQRDAHLPVMHAPPTTLPDRPQTRSSSAAT